MKMKLGYARVSTEDQKLTAQLEALKAAGCEKLFREKISGRSADRPELIRMLDTIRQGDVLVVTKLDRLARSTRDLLEIVDRIAEAGASFLSLAEPWADTTSHTGKLIMTVFAGIAEFERERIAERCKEGRRTARKNGIRFGRPLAIGKDQIALIVSMRKGGKPFSVIAKALGVCTMTITRALKRAGWDDAYPDRCRVQVAYAGDLSSTKDQAIDGAAQPGACIEARYELRQRRRIRTYTFLTQKAAKGFIGQMKDLEVEVL